MESPLTALADIISSQVKELERAYSKDGLTFPSLDEPFCPTPLDKDAAAEKARSLIVAAAAQLIATVCSPFEFLPEAAGGMSMTFALGFVEEVNIPDIMKEAGPQVCSFHISSLVQPVYATILQGIHVKDISAINHVEPSYIGNFFMISLLTDDIDLFFLSPSFTLPCDATHLQGNFAGCVH